MESSFDVGNIIAPFFTLVIMLPFAIGFMIAGNHMIKKRRRIKANGEVVELPVIRMIEDATNTSSSDGNYHGPSYYPVFELNYGGQTYELKNQTWSHKTKEGDLLEIMFNRDNPNEYEIVGDKRMAFISYLFFFTGVFFLIAALVLSVFFIFI